MSSPFSITALADTVKLDDQGQGVAVFTVSNDTGAACEIRVLLETDEPATRSWLKISGEVERPLSSTGSEQYVVNIRAPGEAAPGAYHFRIRVLDVGDPDDTFSVSPNIGFEVSAPKPEPKPDKPFPWWIVAVAVVVVLIGSVVTWLLLRGDSTLAVTLPANGDIISIDQLADGFEFTWEGGDEEDGFTPIAVICRTDVSGSECPLSFVEPTDDRVIEWDLSDAACAGCSGLTAAEIQTGLQACAVEAVDVGNSALAIHWGVLSGRDADRPNVSDLDAIVGLSPVTAEGDLLLSDITFTTLPSFTLPPSITLITLGPVVIFPVPPNPNTGCDSEGIFVR